MAKIDSDANENTGQLAGEQSRHGNNVQHLRQDDQDRRYRDQCYSRPGKIPGVQEY